MAQAGFRFNSVLLIDDSEIDVLVNRRLIELTQFARHVTVTDTAEEALHYLREECSDAAHAPDWIFLDMHLPGMSGFDFIDEFVRLPAEKFVNTRIIILSVFQKPEHLQKIEGLRCIAGQIDKPLTQQALRDLSNGIIRKVNASS